MSQAADPAPTRANHVPLSPVSFLARTAEVHPDRTAVVYGALRLSYRQLQERCRRLAGALAMVGVGRGDTVSIMAPNVPAHLEAHFGVPMAGAVLHSINTRLDAPAIAFMLEHAASKVLLVDREYGAVVRDALSRLRRPPLVVDIADPAVKAPPVGGLDYDDFLAGAVPAAADGLPADEWDSLALNYTSGTTGDPKGVLYHHRGAYLNALGNLVAWSMGPHPVYLWTLPMFHCNGWCFPWTVTALAGTHVCLRRVEPAAVFEALRGGVTHFCGAPTVLTILANADEGLRRGVPAGIRVMTAGAAPPAAIIHAMEAMGFDVAHVYGLTEVYGPCVVCEWKPEWSTLPAEERAALKARQGVRNPLQEGLEVMDPALMRPVPADGATLGEVMIRGNIVMKGYLKNAVATEEAFAGGWFHTGDLAVRHPDGYVELKDRSKDIVISGGENISTIEVEGVLYRHPAVLEAAVVARPDPKWGETPCAFVALKPGAAASEEEIIAFCRERLAHFKAPRRVVFRDLPKTSTGKIQKFVLRDAARAL
ncbi:MAG TPA: acyl-CoA synthetase [Azospirillaceae bacterium]|nr:acyl-CoA synthetase [Azospirillaceae bacterium]